ncbi:uncharacterized protein PG986_014490 [Apiospora aurea]|uniref:Uncharacterized protein n=1 Tax=Apiospora aurea TaxID=335848 RepID=A0ABR1PT50_9PEZI
MQSSMARRSQNSPIPTGRHSSLCSQDANSTTSGTQQTDFRLPEEWEAQEILDKEVIGGKSYYLIGWKPTLVPETEITTSLLQAWRHEMDNLVPPNRDSVLESHVVLQRCDQWLGTIIGEEAVGGTTHCRVQWEPTFEPEGNLMNMGKLLQEWKLKFQSRSGRLYTKRDRVVIPRKAGRGRSPKRRNTGVDPDHASNYDSHQPQNS